ncbi:MAG: cytochrome oxidase complex assembly protein 1-domain-containing protein [Linnemannia elongata]|nr:MAG: cytochrome oxidase complex assembly protein 1-domain-containing protein [Linnemannia elongata]
MATCARIQHTLGLQRSILSTFIPRVSSKPSSVRFYTSSSKQTTSSNSSATATPKFVQNPAFKSTSSLNQSRHSPQFKTQTTQLPNVASRTPIFILAGILGAAFWAGSIAVAANHQRQGTSIVRGTLFNVKFDTKAQELLGNNIDFVNPSWPWISGTVAHLKGRVDIEFQVRGDKAEGRVHFVAVRPAKQWITTDFTLTMPDGTCVIVGENTVLPEISN